MKDHVVIGEPVNDTTNKCSEFVTEAKRHNNMKGPGEECSRVTPVVFDPKVHCILKCLRRRL
jgi:hypothetical protein